MNADKELVVSIAKAIVQYKTSGLCHYGKVCALCDCFADLDRGEARDMRAFNLATDFAKDIQKAFDQQIF